MLASRMGYSEIVQLLLADSRVDVNMQCEVRISYDSKLNILPICLILLCSMDARPSYTRLKRVMVR
jgi:hypothetical protein